MSSLNRKRPPQIRFWKAKLQPLGRTSFWVSATLLSLLLAFAWKYSSDPDWVDQLFNRTTTSENNTATDEAEAQSSDPATGAEVEELDSSWELDNSYLLLKEYDRTTKSKNRRRQQPNTDNTQSNQSPSADDILAQLIPALPTQVDAQQQEASLASPNFLPTSGLSFFNNLSNNSPLSYSSSGSINNSSNQANLANTTTRGQTTIGNSPLNLSSQPDLPPENFLQQALDKLTPVGSNTSGENLEVAENRQNLNQSGLAQNFSGQLQLNNTQIPRQLGTNSGFTVPTTPTTAPNSFTVLTQPQFNGAFGSTTPLTPTQSTFTPTSTAATNPLPNTLTGANTNEVNVPRLITNPGFQPNFRSPALQPLPGSQTQNGNRRNLPGSFIGGGEISTFANP